MTPPLPPIVISHVAMTRFSFLISWQLHRLEARYCGEKCGIEVAKMIEMLKKGAKGNG